MQWINSDVVFILRLLYNFFYLKKIVISLYQILEIFYDILSFVPFLLFNETVNHISLHGICWGCRLIRQRFLNLSRMVLQNLQIRKQGFVLCCWFCLNLPKSYLFEIFMIIIFEIGFSFIGFLPFWWSKLWLGTLIYIQKLIATAVILLYFLWNSIARRSILDSIVN